MIQLEDPRISMLVSQDSTTIELHDSKSAITFVKITLTNDQLASMLSRLSRTECSATLHGIEKIGKKMHVQEFVFKTTSLNRNIAELDNECLNELKNRDMEEWIPQSNYSSQNSFFTKEGVHYARTNIRKWV